MNRDASVARSDKPVNPKFFFPLAACGGAVMAYGVYGLFANAAQTNPPRWVLWFVGMALFHDFVIAPLAFLVGVILAKIVPPSWRAFATGGLVITAVVTMATLPFVLGLGDSSHASVLPFNYGLNLVIALGAVWTGIGALALWTFKSR